MSEHSIEPWKLYESRDARPHSVYAGKHMICEINHSGYIDKTLGRLQLANAQRIVKCVNALHGVDNPSVWRAQMTYMDSDHTISLDIIQALRQQYTKLEHQRDALLKFVKEYIEAWDNSMAHDASLCRSANKLIAEIEGDKS